MPITSPGNDDDTGENHQPTLRKNTAEPVEQTLKQNTQGRVLQEAALARLRLVQTESGWVRRPLEHEAKTGRFEWAGPGGVPESVSGGVISNLISPSFGVQFIQASCQPLP